MQKPALPTLRPFTTSQARGLGYDNKALSRLVADHVLQHPFTGVYLNADLEITGAVWAQTAALVINDDAVLCDRSAAEAWGIDAYRYGELDVVPPLEYYTLRGSRAIERHGCRGGQRDLKPEDWCLLAGVRVTTPIRTALDLGCNLYARDALAAMNALARAHDFSSRDLTRSLPRYRRRRGVVQLRRLVRLVDPRVESAGESWTCEVLDGCGFEMPKPQHWIYIDGVPTYRLDLVYEHARIVIEYDGEEFHSREGDKDRDKLRRKWLRDHGWYVIVLRKDSFTPEAIDAWTCELRDELVARTRSNKRF